MLDRRAILGLGGLGAAALGALGYAGTSGRIDLFTPALPEDGDLPPLPGLTFNGHAVLGLNRSAFFDGVSLLNVWASWCPDCRVEHAALMALSKRAGISLYGLAADDTEANAAAFLRDHGNPFRRVSLEAGRVYQKALKHRGIPQTYVFNKRGEYIDKVTGALTDELLKSKLEPAIARAKAA